MFIYLTIGLITLAIMFAASMLMCKVDESYRRYWESYTERISVMVLGFTGIVLLWPFVIALNIFVLISNKT